MSYFGACPTCHKAQGHINIGGNNWMFCDQHQVKWKIGENLFSDWKDQSNEIFYQNYLKLKDYQEVKPYTEPEEQL